MAGHRASRLTLTLSVLHAAVLTSAALPAFAIGCKVVAPHTPSAAEQAFLAADYDKSVGLYRTELAAHPNDPEQAAGLVRTLLRQQKLDDASAAITAAIAANPNSAVLLTARAEVEHRRGYPWDAANSIAAAFKADPCLPRLHYETSRLAQLNSLHATARREILAAHQLDPSDPDIRGAWIGTLSLHDRIAEMEKYLAEATGDDPEEKHHERNYLERMKRDLAEPRKPCRLVSSVTSTEIPFIQLLYDATHIRAYGLEVKLNDHAARLEIDTGAGGLLITHSIAEHAHIKNFANEDIGGVGDETKKNGGFSGYADSIKIGNLEFRDCAVSIVDNQRLDDSDGLIGMDVFSKFLVTLNFPARKLSLAPLPPRPGETATPTTLGTGDDATDTDESEKAAAPPPAASAPTPPPAAPSRGPYDRYIAPDMKDYTAIYRNGHDLLVPVSLDKSKLKLFILDTGAWATSISLAAAREVTKVHPDSMEIHGLSGKVEKAYTANEITFYFAKLSQTIRYVPSFDTANISKNSGIEVSGLLGARTLDLTTIHIDYRDGLVRIDYDPKVVPIAHTP
jgi:tetratricopeptide (TPR) repeat protein